VPIFCSPEPCTISSVADHTHYLAFSTWGLDLVGPFKKAKGGFTHIFVTVDTFTKWVEVKPTTFITAVKAVQFVKETMYMFGVPNNIISNNGTHFTAREFKDFCVDSGIKVNYASVSQPQSSGQVECSNNMILQGLKPRIFDRLKPYTGRWVKELPLVLWALRTTLSHAMDHTPFSLVYGSEAMLPTEVEHKSFRVQHFKEERSNNSRVDDLTKLEELCEVVVIQSARHQ
jgi:transposase InsO family protein